MILSVLPIVGAGLLIGFQHAFEPDHLAAVTTLAIRRDGAPRPAVLGMAWGVGHTVSVTAMALLLMGLGVRVPTQFYSYAELAVAALLIFIGASAALHEWRRDHHGLTTIANHATPIRTPLRAFSLGVTHGLAGSGAILALLVTAATTRQAQIGYLLAFGLGTITGMTLVSTMAGAAVGKVSDRSGRVARGVRLAAATASLGMGVILGIGVLSQLGRLSTS